jgi:hypothetical protein
MARALPVCLVGAPAAAALAAFSTWACTGPGNDGQSSIDASLVEAVPWVNGGVPILVDGGPVIPAAPVYPPIASGAPDPGSGPVDCTVLDGIVTSPGFYDTFEAAPIEGGVGVAIAWTGYDDLSWGSFRAPGDITWYSGPRPLPIDCIGPRCDPAGGPNPSLWGVAAYPMGGPSCHGEANDWSLHFRGGLFRNWGGGVSTVITDPRLSPPYTPGVNIDCSPFGDICPPTPAPGATVDSAGLPLTLPDGTSFQQSHAFVDASAYDGIAFWARTGPEGQTAMIVTITDNFTSDRLARENQTFCRRLKQCYTQCLSGAPCTPTTVDPQQPLYGPIYRCFDPASGPFPGSAQTPPPGTDIPALLDLLYPRCGPSACTSPSTYVDNDFKDKDCRPYTFPAADYSAEYCWSDGDPPPPDRDEQCLDGWAAAVDLSLDWHYFTIPWSKMHQGGFGKQAPYFNTKAIDTVAFGFIDGWADVYVDNVSFYRSTQ